MSLPKEVQEILEIMLSHLTLKEADTLSGFIHKENSFHLNQFMNRLSVELVWKIQREAMEQEEIAEIIDEPISGENSLDGRSNIILGRINNENLRH